MTRCRAVNFPGFVERRIPTPNTVEGAPITIKVVTYEFDFVPAEAGLLTVTETEPGRRFCATVQSLAGGRLIGYTDHLMTKRYHERDAFVYNTCVARGMPAVQQ